MGGTDRTVCSMLRVPLSNTPDHCLKSVNICADSPAPHSSCSPTMHCSGLRFGRNMQKLNQQGVYKVLRMDRKLRGDRDRTWCN